MRLGLSPDDVVLGTFRTYAHGVAELLSGTLAPLLARDSRRVALLMGRGSKGRRRARVRSDRGARVLATGELELAEVAAHLASCAAVLQPYPDGITSRRTSAMAGLALGVPVITNVGPLAEPFWSESGAVALAPEPTVEALVRVAEGVLTDRALRAALGARGRAFYRETLSLDRGIRALRGS